MSQWVRHRDILQSWAGDLGITDGGWGEGWGEGFGSGQALQEPGTLINQCVAYATAIANFYGDTPDQTGNVSALNRLRAAYRQISTNLGYTITSDGAITLNERIIRNMMDFSANSPSSSISQYERMIEILGDEFNRIMQGSEVAGRDMEVTCSRLGEYKNVITGDTVLENNAGIANIGSLPVISVLEASENIISSDCTGYSKFESGDGVVSLSVNDITVTQEQDSDRAFAGDTSVSVEAGKQYTVSTRITANTLDRERSCIVVNNNGNLPIGAGVTGVVSYTFIAASTENVFVRFGQGAGGAGGVGSITFSEVRMVQSNANGAAFVDGSVELESHGSDIISVSPDWGDSGSIIIACAPIGYGGVENPVSPTARLFNNTNLFLATPGNVSLFGSGASPILSTSGALTRSQVDVIIVDYDGENIGVQFNDEDRIEGVEADIPSGTLYIGNVSVGIAAFNGMVFTAHVKDKVLDNSERQSAVGSLKDILGDMLSDQVKIIACYGDSTTTGAGIDEGDDYPALLSKTGNYQSINRGVGGYDPTQIAAKYISDADLFNSNVLVLCDVGDNAGTAASQITQFNTAISAHESGINIVIGRFLTSDVSSENAELEAEYGNSFIDIKPVLQQVSGEEDFASLRIDTVHLNADGNQVVADAVHEKIIELLRT
jgi:hypothetical protein